MKLKITFAIIIALLTFQKSFSHDALFKGKIVNYETNAPMPGVTILEKNHPPNGTISDKDGNFEIKIESDTTHLEFYFVTCYPIKFMNIPIEKKHIDLGEIKMAQNYLLSNMIICGPSTPINESDKQKDIKLKKDILEKYRIKVFGKKLKPYFEARNLIFDFNKN